MSITSASSARAPERLAWADLCRFVAACYYEPAAEFSEERLLDSMAEAARRVDGDLAARARRLGETFAASEELLVDYTRLFLGPSEAFARPYASAWMNCDAAQVVALYAEAGFEIDESFRELPDHVAAELEFLYVLLHDDRAELARRFLEGHLAKWIPPFARAVAAGARTPFYRELAELTKELLQSISRGDR